MLREAIHEEGGEEEKEKRRRGNGQAIGESYKPFSKEVEPEKEGTAAMLPKAICETVKDLSVYKDLHIYNTGVDTFTLFFATADAVGKGGGGAMAGR